jgi:hypothetical protein
VAAGTQRPDPLRYFVDRRRKFGVLRLEHSMQRMEARSGNVPVKVVCFQVDRVRIGK